MEKRWIGLVTNSTRKEQNATKLLYTPFDSDSSSQDSSLDDDHAHTKLFSQYLPFIIVFGSVILLFLGLCIYVICVCPSFMRDLQIETKNADSDSDDEESQTCTTELTSGVSVRHSSGRYDEDETTVELQALG